jgi:hypothetical protein
LETHSKKLSEALVKCTKTDGAKMMPLIQTFSSNNNQNNTQISNTMNNQTNNFIKMAQPPSKNNKDTISSIPQANFASNGKTLSLKQLK